MKFQKGDLITPVKNHNKALKVGVEYKVLDSSSQYVFIVDSNDHRGGWYHRRFKLVPSANVSKFFVGAVVRAIKPSTNLKVHHVYEISHIFPSGKIELIGKPGAYFPERFKLAEIETAHQPVVSEKKDTNPKDAVGIKKVPFSTISAPVLAEVGVAMMEGALKYGRHNYRIAGVRASVYYDASMRHLTAFWEGEDIDPLSGLSHVTKAIAGLTVLRDSMIQGNWKDDRPPATPSGWQADLDKKAGELIEKFPTPAQAYTEKDHGKSK